MFKKLREEAERRKKPAWKEVKGRNGEVEACAESKLPAAPTRTSTREHADPGLINPAYEESEEGRVVPFKKNKSVCVSCGELMVTQRLNTD